MRDARCRIRDVRWEMRDAGCGMRDAGCKMGDAGYAMRDSKRVSRISYLVTRIPYPLSPIPLFLSASNSEPRTQNSELLCPSPPSRQFNIEHSQCVSPILLFTRIPYPASHIPHPISRIPSRPSRSSRIAPMRAHGRSACVTLPGLIQPCRKKYSDRKFTACSTLRLVIAPMPER